MYAGVRQGRLCTVDDSEKFPPTSASASLRRGKILRLMIRNSECSSPPDILPDGISSAPHKVTDRCTAAFMEEVRDILPPHCCSENGNCRGCLQGILYPRGSARLLVAPHSSGCACNFPRPAATVDNNALMPAPSLPPNMRPPSTPACVPAHKQQSPRRAKCGHCNACPPMLHPFVEFPTGYETRMTRA